MKWEEVCRPKMAKGLGLGHLKEKSLALLGKWLWRFSNESNSLWHSIIHNKYGMDLNGWDYSNYVSPPLSLL